MSRVRVPLSSDGHLPEQGVPSITVSKLREIAHVLNAGFPSLYPEEVIRRVELGHSTLVERSGVAASAQTLARLESVEAMSAWDELLAAGAFASEFGPGALTWPATAADQRKPEFWVSCDAVRIAVECRLLRDSEAIQLLNQELIDGEGMWIRSSTPEREADRLRAAVAKKVLANQGGGPTVIIVSSMTPWLMPAEMESVVRRVLCQPGTLGLPTETLPIVIACTCLTVLQGVWFCDAACAAANVDAPLRQRLRTTIQNGYIARGDGVLMSEASW